MFIVVVEPEACRRHFAGAIRRQRMQVGDVVEAVRDMKAAPENQSATGQQPADQEDDVPRANGRGLSALSFGCHRCSGQDFGHSVSIRVQPWVSLLQVGRSTDKVAGGGGSTLNVHYTNSVFGTQP